VLPGSYQNIVQKERRLLRVWNSEAIDLKYPSFLELCIILIKVGVTGMIAPGHGTVRGSSLTSARTVDAEASYINGFLTCNCLHDLQSSLSPRVLWTAVNFKELLINFSST
jgi:hypothetical protein